MIDQYQANHLQKGLHSRQNFSKSGGILAQDFKGELGKQLRGKAGNKVPDGLWRLSVSCHVVFTRFYAAPLKKRRVSYMHNTYYLLHVPTKPAIQALDQNYVWCRNG